MSSKGGHEKLLFDEGFLVDRVNEGFGLQS